MESILLILVIVVHMLMNPYIVSYFCKIDMKKGLIKNEQQLVEREISLTGNSMVYLGVAIGAICSSFVINNI